MSRLLLLRRCCVQCKPCPASLLTPRVGARARLSNKDTFVLWQQQLRRFTRIPIAQTLKHQSKLRFWVYGIGTGIVLALGLKYQTDSSKCDETRSADEKRTSRYVAAIQVSRDLVERIKDEVGAPGMVVGVSVDGRQVWCEGLGYADLENRVPCTPDTVMRIASISKPLTTAAVAYLHEEGKLDLDVPVQNYVPEFPQKQYDGEDVTITPRMILSHLSGIRHYEKDAKKVREDREKAKRLLKPPAKEEKSSAESKESSAESKGSSAESKGSSAESKGSSAESKGSSAESKESSAESKESSAESKESSAKSKESSAKSNEKTKTEDDNAKPPDTKQRPRKKEFEQEEYYMKDNFESVIHALDVFKDDPLIFKPGTTFLYSTHAFTLLSAVVERAAGKRFLDVMMNMFRELGMMNTVPEENDPIIYHRSRFYHLNKRGRVVNCPYVDNSYKWAGGGFLSTVGDLLLFGNALLYSYQFAHLKDTTGLLPGFLKPQTSLELWAPADRTEASWDKDGLYAQGWLVVEKQQKYGHCRKRRYYVSHTGGAVGASSVLLVLPSEENPQPQTQSMVLPQGVVVTIITNMQSVGLNGTALKIAHEFEKAKSL